MSCRQACFDEDCDLLDRLLPQLSESELFQVWADAVDEARPCLEVLELLKQRRVLAGMPTAWWDFNVQMSSTKHGGEYAHEVGNVSPAGWDSYLIAAAKVDKLDILQVSHVMQKVSLSFTCP